MIGPRPKSRLFWLLQISGWLTYLVISLAFYHVRGMMSTATVVRYATAAVAGFLATLLLRFLYKALNLKDRRILPLALSAIGLCLLGANVQVWTSDLLKVPFSGAKALAANLPVLAYAARVVWWMTPLTAWSALYFGIGFWQQWTVQKKRTEQAEALAQAAQLQMLRYRLNPHFLFNALNSIRALIPDDKASAKAMVTELSEFLRYALVSKNYENVPLKDEIDSLRHYFNIQKIRYENKLDVSLEVDPAAEEYPIPSFILYPLAENAVLHGLRSSPLPLRIRIQAGVREGRFLVEIFNSGSWNANHAPENGRPEGRGLDNVRRRLAEAYPGKHHLDIIEKDGGVRVRLSLPAAAGAGP